MLITTDLKAVKMNKKKKKKSLLDLPRQRTDPCWVKILICTNLCTKDVQRMSSSAKQKA